MKRFFVAPGVDQDVTVSSREMEHQLDDCDPKACVLYSHSPSVQVYFALRNRLEKSSEAWLNEFIFLDGLESLLDSLCHMVGPKFCGFSDAILQIDCLSCIRAVLNSQIGMEALVSSPSSLKKLLKGVDLANTLPKKHIIEILSVVCVYNEHAYRNLLEAMEEHKVFGSAKMVSFVNILQDLLAVETSNKQKSDVVWQILERHVHHIVHATDNISSLSKLEAETMCQVIDIASRDSLGKSGRCSCSQHCEGRRLDSVGNSENTAREIGCQTAQVSSQSERRAVVSLKTSADSGYLGCEEKLSPRNENKEIKDMSNSQNVSPEQIKPSGPGSLVKNELDVDARITNIEKLPPKTKKRQVSVYDNTSPERELLPCKMAVPTKYGYDKYKQLKLNNLNIENGDCGKDLAAVTVSSTTKLLSNANLVLRNIQPPTKPFESQIHNVPASQMLRTLQFQPRPTAFDYNTMVFPSCPMKNLKWIKLEEALVELFPHSLWNNTRKLRLWPDFKKVEELFKETNASNDNTEAPLLSNQTRISLNLFLNRLEEEPTELVKRLLKMDGPPLSLPFIKHLSEILPEHAEIKLLKQYNGNLLELGPAEQFVLHLSDLPDYRVLVTGHLRRAEFAVVAPHLRSVLGSMLDVSRAVLCSEGLQEVLLLVLKLGNFLNHGQFNGYAGGFRLSSLGRLADVKSSESGQNLVHFIVSVVESGDERLLAFLSEIARLEKAASSSPSDIKEEFDKLNTQINSFVRQLAGANTIVREGFDGFLEEVKSEFRELQAQITELKFQSQRLSEFFCESDGFELQSCFNSLLTFFKELRRCRHETRLLQKQKDMAIKQSNMFKQQLARKNNARKFGQKVGANSSAVEVRTLLVEELITELHRGNFHPAVPDTEDLGIHLQKQAGKTTETAGASENLLQSKAVDAAPELPPKNSLEGEARRREGTTTPDRDLDPMELSHISVMGTPMMNRPRSDAYDEELTLAALNPQPRLVTSSVQDLPKGQVASMNEMRAPPVLSIQHPLTRVTSKHTKTHHRSRSDLGESMNGTTKWIRYQQQIRQDFHAPLARPESSMTLATLNLEAVNTRHPLTQSARQIALVPGPTIAMPSCIDGGDDLDPQEFVRGGKKGERKSGTLSNFLTKISKRVLRQKNSTEPGGKGPGGRARDSNSGSEDGHSQDMLDRCNNAGESKGGLRAKSKAGNSMGRVAGMQVLSKKSKSEDKENMVDVNPFDRQKKNPIRLSNRLKGKLSK
ncbi:inverted formin-2-like [Plakobranchus ocellatus]|uniref:Inverted formin-2-like n=1 Tax=Plakobranchus ocellatus TaxID=259542 RepID=A0AAV3YQG3_9GAST|nr:inverted formin-2-like [Plakobranchus ocellatus]